MATIFQPKKIIRTVYVSSNWLTKNIFIETDREIRHTQLNKRYEWQTFRFQYRGEFMSKDDYKDYIMSITELGYSLFYKREIDVWE